MNSEVSLEDDPTALFSRYDIYSTNKEFKLIEKSSTTDYVRPIKERIPLRDREYLKIYLRADPAKHLYMRSVDGLLTIIGDIGGITELVIMIGAAIISKFIEHMANSKLISEIYQVQ